MHIYKKIYASWFTSWEQPTNRKYITQLNSWHQVVAVDFYIKTSKTFQVIYSLFLFMKVCYIKNVQNIKYTDKMFHKLDFNCKLGGPRMYCGNFCLMIMFWTVILKMAGKISNFLRSHIVQGPSHSSQATPTSVVSPQTWSTFEAAKSGCPFYVRKSSSTTSHRGVLQWRALQIEWHSDRCTDVSCGYCSPQQLTRGWSQRVAPIERLK